MKKNSFLNAFYLWSTVILWASAFIGIRIGLNGYSPGSLALLRYLVASIGMALVYFNLPKRQKTFSKDSFHIMLIGVIGIGIYNITLNYGEMTISAGIASFIVSMMPVFTTLFSIVWLKEKVSLQNWFGIIVSFTGVSIIALGEYKDFHLDYGIFYTLIAAVCGSYYALAQKSFLRRYHPLELASLAIWGSTLMLLIFLPQLIADISKAPWQTTLAIVYLGIVPAAIAYTLWSYALARVSASYATMHLYAMPIIATILDVLLIGEVPQWISLFGGLLALSGAILVNYFDLRASRKLEIAQLSEQQLS